MKIKTLNQLHIHLTNASYNEYVFWLDRNNLIQIITHGNLMISMKIIDDNHYDNIDKDDSLYNFETNFVIN